jgi:hypothetical protein
MKEMTKKKRKMIMKRILKKDQKLMTKAGNEKI